MSSSTAGRSRVGTTSGGAKGGEGAEHGEGGVEGREGEGAAKFRRGLAPTLFGYTTELGWYNSLVSITAPALISYANLPLRSQPS